jgi:serine/threonine protein kinase
MDLSGYEKLIRLHGDVDTSVYRATRVIDRTSVLARVARRSASHVVERLEREFALRKYMDPVWCARPLGFVEHRELKVLLLEDSHSVFLDQLFRQPLAISDFLRLAVNLANVLAQAHSCGLIHKDIKPANVLVDSDGKVRLTGFGIASQLLSERQDLRPPEVIAGTLAYMAPEQTGRMNRAIDSRSDLYSLGVTLYEVLTGSLPYSASEPMEWVHCHVARQPVPLSTHVQDLPAPIISIIMKLLAKTAEERYQTAAGVEHDLRRCLSEWETRRSIAEFPSGEHDIADRLCVPQTLYGRAKEIEILHAAFERVAAGGRPELVLVSGYSGIGKSSVVNELHRWLVPPRGQFAAGKFDQYKRDIPYATIAEAFRALVDGLLSKSEREIKTWRDALREALGLNGRLLTDLVPGLRHIVGDQPPVPELPAQDAQRRFHLVIRRFINVFARHEHPLALFLDDLQWLDVATLDLLEDLLGQPDQRHLLLIGAYRDNEVNSGHPLIRKLTSIREAGMSLRELVLAPLTREDVQQLVTDTVHSEPESASPLATAVHDKTAGNPFFVIQFLAELSEEGILTFDHRSQ